MSLTRHQVREVAFQVAFAQKANQDVNVEALTDQIIDGRTVAPDNEQYLQQLVSGIVSNKEDLDSTVAEKLKDGWTLQRLAKPDLTILELGTFEILHTETPNSVAINEAIELAKEYTDESSKSFINGVLSKIAD
ncbi:transcription antitermination factor NusB [Pediococcus claussenii]|uniref:Transcription antitermination protein NusB n=1 Tax=Pediococcus claussenii (strain ATCC BAA-344 / DSM 14800 / JCM 18046 / KCTC 3811 / LMG 21948 / P06) TaxID=701521 RepID=G8PDJ7_PEDCP|nr:transcription antitermination factor NusB [Pediococcus claussenii]AEV95332.1 transcription antitermination factor NusB [Pediococcus claussenii ATCC BAA-344]ANZ68864.1 transcription antitermination factor NusB [Pediococcus claussenii]ANZ70680.1 transcription antitermination factor NusB [Pediococcus claussenii]KRN19486.1 nusB protein [Pediococcus claussenii]